MLTATGITLLVISALAMLFVAATKDEKMSGNAKCLTVISISMASLAVVLLIVQVVCV